jgi:hypothetical protein
MRTDCGGRVGGRQRGTVAVIANIFALTLL